MSGLVSNSSTFTFGGMPGTEKALTAAVPAPALLEVLIWPIRQWPEAYCQWLCAAASSSSEAFADPCD